MKIIIKWAFLFVLWASIFSLSHEAKATDPCSCTVHWSGPDTTSGTFFYNGCTFTTKFVVWYRKCGSDWQVRFKKLMVSTTCLGPFGPADCSAIREGIEKLAYLFFTDPINSPISPLPTHVQFTEQSTCFYTLEVNPSQDLKDCWGNPPGAHYFYTAPCDTTGCCVLDLTYDPSTNMYVRTVIFEDGTCGQPNVPPVDSVQVGCDVRGGGVRYFTVAILPGQTVNCVPMCSSDNFNKKESARIIMDRKLERISVFPIPFKDNLVVQFDEVLKGKTTATLIDMKGRVIKTQEVKVIGSQQLLSIDTHGVKQGDYTLQIRNGNSVRQFPVCK